MNRPVSTKDRWDFTFDDGKIYVSPRVQEMQEFIHEKTAELAERIAKAEETLVVQNLSTEALERLKTLATEELKRRKDFKL